jgi:hypothetical protein
MLQGVAMPFTTIYIPEKLLSKIDKLVQEKGISRHGFIVEACEQALKNSGGQWPDSLFKPDISETDLRLLREGVGEMESAIQRARRNNLGVDL